MGQLHLSQNPILKLDSCRLAKNSKICPNRSSDTLGIFLFCLIRDAEGAMQNYNDIECKQTQETDGFVL